MAGQTMSEKLISAHAGRPVRAGEIAIVNVDKVIFQDWTGPLSVKQILALGIKPKLAKNSHFFFDHASPSYNKDISNNHKMMREFAAKYGANVHDIGTGIIHTQMVEWITEPGDLIIGSDSHTCLSGCLGAFATGVGSTDAAVACALGKTWLRCPETIQVKIDGKPPRHVGGKDIVLSLIGQISAEGANYKALEFTGSTVRRMPYARGRITLSEQAAEAGAKTGLFATDDMTKAWLKQYGRAKAFKKIAPDKDAKYEKTIHMKANELQPVVAKPHQVENVVPVRDKSVKKVNVDQVFIGSCSNGMLEDLSAAANILKGRKVNPRTRLLVTPASKDVLLKAIKAGVIETLVKAGAVVMDPGCGPCPGGHQGLLADGEVCLTTIPRNFKGRMGNPKSFVYLANPEVCAASALTGKITHPEDV